MGPRSRPANPRADHASVSSIRRLFWLTLADSYLVLALQLASTIILARILTPTQLGVFAIASVFSALASMLRDFGVGEYLIQERELTNEKIAAALSLNLIVSWTMAAAMYGGAGAAASFYASPGVGEVMRVQALMFLLVPFGAVTMAWFRRELNYQPVLICNIAGSVAGFVVSVVLALRGHGYMSLAWSAVIAVAVTVSLSLWFRPASFPRLPGLRGIAEVFHFSKFASGIYIAAQAGKGAPEMIIGRADGVVGVAMFSRANGLVEVFNRLAVRPVMLVCMPYLAKARRDGGDIQSAYATSVSYLTAVGWTFLGFMGIASFAMIRLVYGDQWDAAAPLAQILCAACAIDLIHVMSREALLAEGQARQANSLQLVLVVLQVLGLLLVIPFGLKGAAWGMVAAALIGVAVSQWFLARCIGLRTSRVVRACVPSLWLCAGALLPAAVWAWIAGVTLDNYIAFAIGGGLVTAVSWLVILRLLRHPLFEELRPLWSRLVRRAAVAES